MDDVVEVFTGYDVGKRVPTFSLWELREDPSIKTLVNATFVVSTFTGPIWAVQHKTPNGTVRDEINVFLKLWDRVAGDVERPERRKAPSSMSTKERLKLAQSLVESVASQLTGRKVEIPATGHASVLLLRARRMRLVVERVRAALRSGDGFRLDPTEISKLRVALQELDQVPDKP